MSVSFACPRCGRGLLAHDELGVKHRRCTGCGTLVEVPAVSGSAVAAPRRDETMSPDAAIQSGRLDVLVEILAERFHDPQQRKIDAGKRWGLFVMTPDEAVQFIQKHREQFDVYAEEASDPHGKALHILLFPRKRENGCVFLAGLALPGNLSAWLSDHPSVTPHGLRIEKSPMDGRPVQINFTGVARNDAVRPVRPILAHGEIEKICRERLYTLGWDREKASLLYYGVRADELGVAGNSEKEGDAKTTHDLLQRMGPREAALLQRLFACSAGARQISDAMGGVDAVLAASLSSHVFGADIAALLRRHPDVELCTVFHGLSTATIPLNDQCAKYFRRPEGLVPCLTGPDPRMITLAFALAVLAEMGRTAPAEVLAQKLTPKFVEKSRRGPTANAQDEWHLGRWAQVYYTAVGATLTKDRVARYEWAIPIFDAVVAESSGAEEALYWRAVAAHNQWRHSPQTPAGAAKARKRLMDFVSLAQTHPSDPVRLNRIRECLAHLDAAR